MARRVRIYTTVYCPFCRLAKELLAGKRVPYEEVDVTDDADTRRWLAAASGRRTVPQIFVDERPIGGFDDLSELDRRGELDALLRS